MVYGCLPIHVTFELHYLYTLCFYFSARFPPSIYPPTPHPRALASCLRRASTPLPLAWAVPALSTHPTSTE